MTDAENRKVQDAYDLGYDCGKNGPNTTNCHFSIFSLPERTRAWEIGKADAEAGKPIRNCRND